MILKWRKDACACSGGRRRPFPGSIGSIAVAAVNFAGPASIGSASRTRNCTRCRHAANTPRRMIARRSNATRGDNRTPARSTPETYAGRKRHDHHGPDSSMRGISRVRIFRARPIFALFSLRPHANSDLSYCWPGEMYLYIFLEIIIQLKKLYIDGLSVNLHFVFPLRRQRPELIDHEFQCQDSA